MLQYSINNIAIPESFITTTFNRDETVEYDNGKILIPSVEFELDKSYISIFDDFWYKWRVTAYDPDTGKYVWDGRLINVEFADDKPTIKLTTAHYLDDTRQVCNLTITHQTPAAAVYQLLTDTTNGAGIPVDYVIQSGFQKAIAIQEANNVYISIKYGEDSETEIKAIIEDICRVTSCKLYVRGNFINFEQEQIYSGELGYQIKINNLKGNAHTYGYDDQNIFNKYYIVYTTADTLAFASGENATSIATYGRYVFGFPDGTDLEEGDPDTDCPITFDTKAAANWCGNLALELNKNIMKKGQLKVFLYLDYIGLGDQIDLYFNEYVNEPCKIITKKYNYNDATITLDYVYRNYPEIVERDTTAPSTPYLHSVETIDSGLLVKFSQNQESDYVGNKIYFTSSDNYYGEYSSKGLSPVDVKTTELIDGLLQIELQRLSPGSNYKIYVTAYDSNRNESEPSNIIASVTTGEPSTINKYEDVPIPESVYTEYLEDRDYLPWYLERDYTQVIAVAGPQGAQGERGEQGFQGIPGDITGPDTSTANNIVVWNSSAGNVVKDSGYSIFSLVLAWATSTGYTAGRMVYKNNSIYVCVSNHTAGTFYSDWLTNSYWCCTGDGPGTIKMAGRSTAEPGYLLCDNKTIGDASSGADYTGDVYREIYEYINSSFGGTYNWSNHNKVNIPDFRGVYPKGAGTTSRVAGVDASGNAYAATHGAYTQDKMQGHIHGKGGTLTGLGYWYSGAGSVNSVSDTDVPKTDGTNGTPRTGHTTEPQSLGVTFMIKY